MTRNQISFWTGFFTGLLASAFIFAAFDRAEAHSWFDPKCCGGEDCRLAEIGELRYQVRNGETGWLVTTDRVTQWIPEFENGERNWRVKQSLDNHNFVCIPEPSNFGAANERPWVQCIYLATPGI